MAPGNRLPGMPVHQLKASAYYKVTDKWTVGATLLAAASSQYLFGDEANLTPPLPGYVTLGASTNYKLFTQPGTLRLGPERHTQCPSITPFRHFLSDQLGIRRAQHHRAPA